MNCKIKDRQGHHCSTECAKLKAYQQGRADAQKELPTQLYYDGWNDGYKQGKADYEAECEKLFEDNPPMHFNREQIFWIKEYIKQARASERADAERDFQNSDYWNDYLAKIIADAKADAIEECIKTLTDYCGGMPNNNLISALEQLKEQKNNRK